VIAEGLAVLSLAAPPPAPVRLPARAPAPLVCIDPGHSANGANLETEPIGPGSRRRKIKDGGGASGEAAVVLKIGKKLRTVLGNRGLRVAMTRTTGDFTIGAGGNVDRAKFCNRRHAALMLRIHADGSTSSATHGVSTLVPAWHRRWTADVHGRSKRAGKAVHRAVRTATGAANRGIVERSDLTGFNWANVPVILVETGFMTNPTERARLRNPNYQWRVARGLANGTERFLGR
jgi:N-acetylmuramoyl-L-alanine amidase